MNNQDEYKYDEAFSFLNEDGELATKKPASFPSSQSREEEANKQVDLIFEKIKTKIKEFSNQPNSLQNPQDQNYKKLILPNINGSFILSWENSAFYKTQNTSYLLLTLFDGFLKSSEYVADRQPKEVKKEFHLYFNSLGEVRWKNDDNEKFYTSNEFADYCLEMIRELIKKNEGKTDTPYR